MGANLSTPEKIAKCCRSGDATSLAALLADLQRNDAGFRANRARYLEAIDENGNTPLTLAAARGHLPCVKLLLQYGANIHHVNSKADGGSALHEAVAHKHEAVVELLLAHGGNPFVENIKGFTAMDIACSTRNVPLLRRLEQCAPYVGWLLMKVPQFGGLGSSWQRRWVVVSHRYPNPKAPPARQLTHCVFLAYKTLASTAPSCRVWLDGARAREVYNPKAEARLQSYGGGGPRIAQAGITLHRKHELPSGVYTTGGHSVGSEVGGVPQEGYTFYLRPDDGSPMSVNSLDRLIRTINNRGFPPPEQAADGAGTSQQAAPGPLQAHAATLSVPAAAMANTPGAWGSGAYATAPASGSAPLPPLQTAESDEEIARRLQEQYDAEAAHQMQQQPSPPGQPGLAAAATPQQQRPQSVSAPSTATAAAAAAGGPDYLTGGFYPPVHFDQQPGSAPAAAAAASQPLYGTSSAPPHMAAAMQAAASGPQDLDTFSRPSAPSLLDVEYPPPPGMPLGGGLAAVGGLQPPPAAALSAPPMGQAARPTEVPLSASGRRMSAPRLEDEGWWDGTPAVAPSRPASEPGDASAAAAAASKPTDSSDDSAFCVVCLDNPSTAGVLHGDSVHKCLCRDCAAMLKENKVANCPMCREPIEAFIMRVF